MTFFRKSGSVFKKSEEVHKQRLFSENMILRKLSAAGFKIRVRKGYGKMKLPHHSVFIATKAIHLASRI
jgi:hypothetical protein